MSAKAGIVLNLVVALGLVVVLLLVREHLGRIFSSDGEVVRTVAIIVPIVCLYQVTASTWNALGVVHGKLTTHGLGWGGSSRCLTALSRLLPGASVGWDGKASSRASISSGEPRSPFCAEFLDIGLLVTEIAGSSEGAQRRNRLARLHKSSCASPCPSLTLWRGAGSGSSASLSAER
eukprot:3923399-Rhodomonas_salina.4